ncbi:MATE family efflux transporter [Clostridium sp. NSJ-49]|uniref:Probable multidrug resistance protein NorM n=1 Tax=Clostridium disporicum TaxID=84024 RepID=A0A174IVW4_9CLOT|nr:MULTISPECIES: MATE family efflux transporter [Clostridium]MBC5624689.1 MATE family efflux transporter [Clostridium sp. NSJ-49]MDU6341471.1 MATE family efflux transporter [Clostridium sp.]CUO91534.1 multidrug resistance protein NorM [Clostridium disporicum]
MKKKIDLVSGNIFRTLFTLSLPILGTSFIQMAYSMVDMIWIGRVGSAAVAAIGTAGFFTWFGSSLVLVTRTGAEVGVSQAVGKKDNTLREKYVYNSLTMAIIIAIIYTLILLIFRNGLIGFFNLNDPDIISMAINYLIIISVGMIFSFLNPQFTGIITAEGNSKTPFIANTIGLVINIILDPILIFGLGPIKPLGVVGAAVATVFAQFIVTAIFIYVFIKEGYKLKVWDKKYLDFRCIKEITKWGTPNALQNCLFSFFGMLIGRIVATWGPVPIAVQKVGSQIESISWMTAGGFASALTAFTGQNYGAQKYKRVEDGYKYTLILSLALGVLTSFLLIVFGKQIFSIFIQEQDAIIQGADYLKILGYSQLFMCIEITTAGAFFGVGKTIPPSVIGIVFTGLRIPLAIYLSQASLLGINGVWWAISLTSIFKGVILVTLFIFMVLKPIKQRRMEVA